VKRWDEERLQRYIYHRMKERRTTTFPLTPTPLDLVVRLLNEQAEVIDAVRAHADQSRAFEQELADVRQMLDECETVDPDLIELPSGDFVSLRDVRHVFVVDSATLRIRYHGGYDQDTEDVYIRAGADVAIVRYKLRQRAGSKITTLPPLTGTIDFTATGMAGDGDGDNETWHVNGSLPPDAVAGIEKKIDELEGEPNRPSAVSDSGYRDWDAAAKEADRMLRLHRESLDEPHEHILRLCDTRFTNAIDMLLQVAESPVVREHFAASKVMLDCAIDDAKVLRNTLLAERKRGGGS